MNKEKVTTQIKFKFNAEQKVLLSEQQAAEKINQENLLEKVKTITAEYKARITAAEEVLSRIATDITNGYELRDYECHLVLNFITKQRNYIDIDTGEILKEEPLLDEDYQTDAFKKFKK